MLFIGDYVTPQDTAAEFEKAGPARPGLDLRHDQAAAHAAAR